MPRQPQHRGPGRSRERGEAGNTRVAPGEGSPGLAVVQGADAGGDAGELPPARSGRRTLRQRRARAAPPPGP